MWEYYLGYSDHVRRKKRKAYFTAKEWREFHCNLPRGLRLVISFTRFDGDILNGGLCQYISNHTERGDPADVYEDLFALKTIGASESVELLVKAINVFRRVYGWPSRQDSPSDVPPPWEHPEIERLDDLRCNEESTRRDYRILNAYLKKHLDECVLPVEVKCRPWFLEKILKSPQRHR
jgi:hypothetical protein